MKEIKWNELKSKRLKKIRGVSFEELIVAERVAIKRHPNKETQSIMLFRYRGYIWVVPYVENKDYKFLKTLYPSRKYMKLYKRGII